MKLQVDRIHVFYFFESAKMKAQIEIAEAFSHTLYLPAPRHATPQLRLGIP